MDRPGGMTERKIEGTGPHQGTAEGETGSECESGRKKKRELAFPSNGLGPEHIRNNTKDNKMCVRGISVAFLVFPLSMEDSFFKL